MTVGSGCGSLLEEEETADWLIWFTEKELEIFLVFIMKFMK